MNFILIVYIDVSQCTRTACIESFGAPLELVITFGSPVLQLAPVIFSVRTIPFKMLGCLKCKYENCIFIREHLYIVYKYDDQF